MFDDPGQVRRSDGTPAPGGPGGSGGFPRLRTDDASDPYDMLTGLFVGPEPTSPPASTPATAELGALLGGGSPEPLALGSPDTDPHERALSEGAPRGVRPERHGGGDDGARSRGATVELLIAGNLPTLAAAWISQYARSAAAQAGEPVALVRLTGATLRVEVHGEPATMVGEATERAALRAAALCARRVIVHGDAEAALAVACQGGEHPPDEISVLFGCDEAGVVSAYRAVKLLAAAWSGATPGGAEGAPERPRGVRLVPIGSAAARAAQASRRIEDAARSFLAATVRCAAPIERVTAGAPARALLDAAATLSLGQVLAALRQAVPSTGSQRPGQADQAGHAVRQAAPESAGACAKSPALDAVPATRLGPVRSMLTRAPVAPADMGAEPVRTLPGQHAGQNAMKHTHAGPAATPTLCELLDSDGPVVPLRARCPHALGVELALDAMGTIHALRDDNAPDAIGDLVAALGWAVEHAAVLALTTTEPLDPAAAPVGHLFTRRPSEARRLVPGTVRVHALARSRSGEWAAVEL